MDVCIHINFVAIIGALVIIGGMVHLLENTECGRNVIRKVDRLADNIIK